MNIINFSKLAHSNAQWTIFNEDEIKQRQQTEQSVQCLESIPDAMHITVDQVCSIRSPREYSNHNSTSNNICSSKQTSDETDLTKYQATNRSSSLPPLQTFSSNQISNENVKQRRRYSSSSNNNSKNITTSLVASFLQYLRSELRAATNENINNYQNAHEKKSSEQEISHDQLSDAQNPIELSPSSAGTLSSLIIDKSQILSTTNLLKHSDDYNEIATLVNLLILRVECLTSDNKSKKKKKKTNKTSSKIKEIDENLIEYLYYLFNKFVNDDADMEGHVINKSKFVSVCQDVVRNGCLKISPYPSPDQSFSESTITNKSDRTATPIHVDDQFTEYINEMQNSKSSNHDDISLSSQGSEQETWLSIDFENNKLQCITTPPDESHCLLSSSTSDEQLLPTYENYFSTEDIKSYESESSQSYYYSPDSSLVDIENMPQDIDDVNNNHNNNNHILLNQEGSSSSSSSTSTEHGSSNANVIREAKDTTSTSNICTGLTNDCSTNNSSNSNEQVASSSSSPPSIETTEQSTMHSNEKVSRRERKMQERWSVSTRNNNKNTSDPIPSKSFLGVEFPPIAALRKKFSASPPSKLNVIPVKTKETSSIRIKHGLNKTNVNNSLQDNIDKLNETTSLNRSVSLENQDTNTSQPTVIENKAIADQQVFDSKPNDTSSLLICYDSKTNDDTQLSSTIISKLLTVEEKFLNDDTKIKSQQIESEIGNAENEIITNNVNDLNHVEQPNSDDSKSPIIKTESIDINSPISSSLSSSPTAVITESLSASPSLTTNTNDEEKATELLPKEIEEEKKEEAHNVADNITHTEKKNNCNVEHNCNDVLGTILINDEQTQHAILLEQEKKENEEKEKEQQPLLTLEQDNSQPSKDDSSTETLDNNNLEINKSSTMPNHSDDKEQQYNKIEIEEIPDEDEDFSAQYNRFIEPTDYILTDDELKIPCQTSTKLTSSTIHNDMRFDSDPIQSFFEQAPSKVVEHMDDSIKSSTVIPSKESSTASTEKCRQHPEDDPIALRALKRFEQRMNAAMATKVGNEDTHILMAKGKSSWSGTISTPRKSLENVFKNDQSTSLNSNATVEPPQRDTFIRPRKTMLDDIGLSFPLKRTLSNTCESKLIANEKPPEEQQIPITQEETIEKQVTSNELPVIINCEGSQQQTAINSSMTNDNITSNSNNNFDNEAEHSNSLAQPSQVVPLNSMTSRPSLEQQQQQQVLAPYRLQLEGRRRLNTLERMRDRHEVNDSNESNQHRPNNYTIKSEELQDPIIRRALERFDEKSRSLSQTNSINYDEIQDPITRRALMRLESNLKRTMPSNSTTPTTSIYNDTNETWYTNSYTLGSLQTNNDNHAIRCPDSNALSMTSNKTPHISVHQRFCSTSSHDKSELPINNTNSNTNQEIPIMRVPTQPIYVTSNNHPQTIAVRPRSQSEDVNISKEFSRNGTTHADENSMANDNNDTTQLQQNHSSSDEIQQQDNMPTTETTDFPIPTTIIKSLDPSFVRTTETSVNYTTPTQTYTAYNCEYTRPHQNSVGKTPKLEPSSPRNHQLNNEHDIHYSNIPPIPQPSAFTPIHPTVNNYCAQQQLPMAAYPPMYTNTAQNQATYSDDPIVRRALERFNSQMQHSLMSTSNYHQQNNGLNHHLSNGYSRQGHVDSLYPNETQSYDPWANNNRSMPATSTMTSTGYQSIIGRRRQIRHDDAYHDITSVGNGYSALSFINSQNGYPAPHNNLYMNLTDEQPPAIPPRIHRDLFREQQQEYVCENTNNNNNNNNYTNGVYMHQPYPPTSNGFRPISNNYIPSDSFIPYQDEEYLRQRALSTSSTTSSDSVHPIHTNKSNIPPTFLRTNMPQNKKISPDNLSTPSGHTTPNNGSTTGDSVFHRLAYTATKSSLSKSSSNLCANLLNKPTQQQQQQQHQQQQQEEQQQPQQKPNTLKPFEIDYDDSPNLPHKKEPVSTSTNLSNKCQRSRSVDGRARIKNAQARSTTTNHHPSASRLVHDSDDNSSTVVPSSKFTTMNPRRDAPPPRAPTTPRSSIPERTPLAKRVTNGSGHNLASTRYHNGNRSRNSNANLIDTDTDENLTFNDNHQPKIIDTKSRTSTAPHRHNNHIQSSASTSSVNSTMSRIKVPAHTPANLDKRDSNASGTDLSNRSSKRSDDHRLVSPTGHRRNVPVSVFSPAKVDTKRSAPVPPPSTSPINDTKLMNNCEPQNDQTSYSSHSSTGDSSYAVIENVNEIENKFSTVNTNLKTSTGNLLDELALANDKHDHNKKMNVFERLFRGHKKKI